MQRHSVDPAGGALSRRVSDRSAGLTNRVSISQKRVIVATVHVLSEAPSHEQTRGTASVHPSTLAITPEKPSKVRKKHPSPGRSAPDLRSYETDRGNDPSRDHQQHVGPRTEVRPDAGRSVRTSADTPIDRPASGGSPCIRAGGSVCVGCSAVGCRDEPCSDGLGSPREDRDVGAD